MNLKSICDGHDKIKTFKENDNENYSMFYAKNNHYLDSVWKRKPLFTFPVRNKLTILQYTSLTTTEKTLELTIKSSK